MTFVAPTTAQTSADDLPPSTVKLQLTNNPQIRTTLALPTTTADGAPSTVQTSDNPTGTTPTTNAPSYSSTTKENPTTYTSATDARRRSIATSTASNTITSTQGILYLSRSITKNPLRTHLNFPQGVSIIFRSFSFIESPTSDKITPATSQIETMSTNEYTSTVKPITTITKSTSRPDQDRHGWFINEKKYEYTTIEVSFV